MIVLGAPLHEGLEDLHGLVGYVKGDPSTDRGGVERDVLSFWRSTGFGAKSKPHKIAAFVKVNPRDPAELRAACWLFGGVYLGVDLHVAQQRQTVWDYVPGSAEWGGHAVPLVGLDAAGNGTVVTWGTLKGVTARFLTEQCEEAWAVLSPDMLRAGKSPAGLDLATLTADLRAVTAA